ncbi:MAG: alpha/beta hydrolase [Bacteroidota bacterium]
MTTEQIILNEEADWVVFVHGAGGSSRTWRKQIEAFRPHFNILLLDLRDHGDSQNMVPPKDGRYDLRLMGQDVVDTLRALEIPRAHFVGVSMGSIVVRWIERLDPEMVISVVLAGGVFRLNYKMKVLLFAGYYASKILPFGLLYRIMAWIVLPRQNHRQSRKIFVRESRKIDPRAYLKWLGMVRTVGTELQTFFNQPITVPTLITMGSQDHVFLGPARQYHANFPAQSTLEIIPGVGHVCNIEAADQFNRRALEFLSDHRQSRSVYLATAQ